MKPDLHIQRRSFFRRMFAGALTITGGKLFAGTLRRQANLPREESPLVSTHPLAVRRRRPGEHAHD